MAEASWIATTDEMPASGRRVLFTWINKLGNRRISIGYHAEPMSIEAAWEEVDFEGADYDEERDAYFMPAGWWEIGWECDVSGDVRDEVTHWMPLPACPVDAPEGGSRG